MIVNDIFITNMAIFMDRFFLLWINKRYLKTRKMLEGHVQVRQDIDMLITLSLLDWSYLLVTCDIG